MPNYAQGIGLFTTGNILAVLRAIPKSNSIYADMTRQARGHGAILSPGTISNWVNKGRTDIRARRNNTANRAVRQTIRPTACRALQAGRQPEPGVQPGMSRPNLALPLTPRR